jgi:hypothetical protein
VRRAVEIEQDEVPDLRPLRICVPAAAATPADPARWPCLVRSVHCVAVAESSHAPPS